MMDSPDARPSTSVELRVRYAETDQMGVVYHANYLVWCEIARTQLIRERGPSYMELEKRGILLAVADASIRYLAAARYDDLIRVEAWIEDVRSRTVTFGYRILRVDETGDTPDHELATATTRLISLGPDTRPRTLPLYLIEALGHAH